MRDKGEIICLQETHSDENSDKFWAQQWAGKMYFAHGTSNSKGVCIGIKRNSEVEVIKISNEMTSDNHKGRLIICQFKYCNETFVLANIYAPNKDDPTFFAEAFKKIADFEGHRIITCDFNLALNVKIDRMTQAKSVNNNNASLHVIQTYMEETMLTDIWRDRNPQLRRYTYMKAKPNRMGSRLDFFLIPIEIAGWCSEAKILPGYKSDHALISLGIIPHNFGRGSGTWKLNNKILEEPEYVEEVNRSFSKIKEIANKLNPHERWEMTKKTAIETSIKYSRERAQNKNFVLNMLEQNLIKLTVELENKHNDDSSLQLVERTRKDIEELMEEKTRGAIFRSKVRWHNDGEKPTKYFLNLEKYRSGAKGMNTLLQENGEILKSPQKILERQQEFYSKLYTSDPDIEFKIDEINIPRLSDVEMNSTKGKIKLIELQDAIKGSKRNKTPGIDGLTLEFYIIFWNQIKHILLDACNYSFEVGKLHSSALKGIINLIPKRSKDSRIIKNLRPISLLPTEYKLIEKVLANRMKPSLESIIHQDQKGFLPGRKIAANIRCILNILEYIQTENESGIIVSIDFEKAFDRIEIKSLLKILKLFNFSNDFVHWTETIYNGPVACVTNHGYLSEFFDVTRSVKQGGPCSAYYFLVCAEILAILLRENGQIEGLNIPDFEKIFGQFADDMDMYMKDNPDSLKCAMNSLLLFCSNTGCKVNYDKTTVYRVGSLQEADAKKYSELKVRVATKSINVLGIEITQNSEKLIELNYMSLLPKIKGILCDWSTRKLSLHGKITIINTLIASLFVYKMAVLPRLPDSFVKKLHEIFVKFIWESKKPKISLAKLQCAKVDGGMGLVNMRIKDDAQKIVWIQELQNEPSVGIFAYHALNIKSLRNSIWQCNLNDDDICKCWKNSFWRDVLRAWARVNYVKLEQITKKTDVLNQLIWYNSHIRVKGRPFIYDKSCQKGLMYLSQLCDPTGHFISPDVLRQNFDLTTLQYNSIVSAIPKEWKRLLQTKNEGSSEKIKSNIEIVTMVKKPTKWYYKHCTRNRHCQFDAYCKWQTRTKSECSYKEFIECFRNINRLTNYSKLRGFQYRLLNNAIILNDRLMLWNIKSTDKCSNCNSDRETALHFFVECKAAKTVYGWAQCYLEKTCNIKIDSTQLKPDQIIYNKSAQKPVGIIEALILMSKYYLYRSKCLQQKINHVLYNSFIEDCRKCEYYNAKTTGSVCKYYKKWHPELMPKINQALTNESNVNLDEFVQKYALDIRVTDDIV